MVPPTPFDSVRPQIRLHALDALRAAALLLGLVLHSILPNVQPPDRWAVGTTQPVAVLAWLAYYLHSFRLELFFLLAGFFGALVVSKRGLSAWIEDRFKRILLVFLVVLLPMKVALATEWAWGRDVSGFAPLAGEAGVAGMVDAGLATVLGERFPTVATTHLWFLYYLSVLSGLWFVGRMLVGRFAFLTRLVDRVRRTAEVVLLHWSAPLVLACATTPFLARMGGMGVATPDNTMRWRISVLAVYGLYFATGWVMYDARRILTAFTARWATLVGGGILVSLFTLSAVLATGSAPALALGDGTPIHWVVGFATSLVMAMSVMGWLGAFLRFLNEPSPLIRYLADASYWIYIVHLPVMVALQVWWANSGMPWFVQIPVLNVVTLAAALATYTMFVRSTWVGAWLNGARREVVPGRLHPNLPGVSQH